MADLSAAKDAARKAAFDRRKRAQSASASDRAVSHLVEFLQSMPGQVISGYWPIRTEIDPRPALQALSASRDIVLPVVAGNGLPLEFRSWSPGTRMIPGDFGAAIPADPTGSDPDILIVPLAAYNARGYRLGYGGGFYDRTLERLRAIRPTLAVGFAYSAQVTPQLPVELTDQPLDAIVTENGVLHFA